MRRFTDSPYEKMMMDTRRGKPECPSFYSDKSKTHKKKEDNESKHFNYSRKAIGR